MRNPAVLAGGAGTNREIRVIIEWCDEKGHSEHEILDLIRRIVDAKPRPEDSDGKDTVQN